MTENKLINKHSNPQIIQKIAILAFSVFLIYTAYPCLNSGEFFSCFFFEIGNFYYLLALVILLLFLKTFFWDNWKKLPYYLSEFLLILFGIYGIVIIQKALQSQVSLKFTIFNLALIFIVSAVLLDFRELFKDILDET